MRIQSFLLPVISRDDAEGMTSAVRCLQLLVALVGCLALAGAAGAQTSFPMLCGAYPAGVQRGKTTEVTVYAAGDGGANLNGAYKALLEGEGVMAEIVPPEKGWPARDPKTPNTLPQVQEIKMRVKVAPDAPVGIREFRIGTSHFGISTAGLLVIGDEPEVLETEPNNDLVHAQPVTIPCVANGKISDNEDVDYYKFQASAGQEIVFTVLCARLEDKMHDLQEHADPLIVLYDKSGSELARNDDYYRADPMLHYKFDKAGEYALQVRDVGYHGNPHWIYRLTMTTRPYVTAVVPCAVRPGQSVDLRVTGFNLGGVQTVHLDVPPSLPEGMWEAPLKFANGLSNAVPLLVTNAPQAALPASPVAAGGEANKTAVLSLADAVPRTPRGTLSLPGGVNAVLEAPDQRDRYTFHAKANEGWAFETTARRLYSEIDSDLKIFDSRGALLAENDDGDGIGKDSHLDWTAPAAGDYTIEVRDLAGHGGPTYFYNLTARPFRPDFRLRCDTDHAAIAPGNRTAWFVQMDRKYGFAGEVKIAVKGLPAGVTVAPLTLPAERSQGVLVLEAAPDAKMDAALLQVIGTADIPGPDGKPVAVSHVAIPLEEIYIPGGGRGLIEAETQGVAVTEPNDLVVTATPQQATLAPGGSVKIEVELKRRADYTKPVSLDINIHHLDSVFTNVLPAGVTIDEGQSKMLLGDNETKGYITLKAAADAKPAANVPLAVLANVSINFVMKVWYAAPFTLTVSAPPKK